MKPATDTNRDEKLKQPTAKHTADSLYVSSHKNTIYSYDSSNDVRIIVEGEQKEANAQRIVKCVNMHEELMNLAKEMATALIEGAAQYCDRKNNSFATVELARKTNQLLTLSSQK